MTTANDILRLAASQIGIAENPDGSNHTKFSEWYGYDAAWCNMFVNWVFYHSGMPIGPPPKGAAWCSTTADWFAQQGRYKKGTSDVKPGDLLFFEWGSTPGGYDHIGIAEQVNPDNIVTIEGNVGNRVQRLVRHRTTGGIDAIARPAFAAITPPKPPEPPKDWFDMASEADLERILDEKLKPIKDQLDVHGRRLNKIDKSFYSGQNPGKRDLYEITLRTLQNTTKIIGEVDDEAGELTSQDIEALLKAALAPIEEEINKEE